MMAKRILIADDEPLYCETTGQLLRKAGFECVCVSDANKALAALSEQSFDLVLSDLNMPGNFKLELLREHSSKRPSVPIIVITGVPSLPTAIESVRLGIADYLLKPVKFDDLLASVHAAIEKAQRSKALIATAEISPQPARNDSTSVKHRRYGMIGDSPAMRELFDVLDRVAESESNILITGESGTGKEEVAKAIHQHSHRSRGLFQVIDCTAIPEALFESTLFGHKKGAFTGAVSDNLGLFKKCNGGTAFLDELGELPLSMQAKLLRAVQQQTFTPIGSDQAESVDTRFICATNRDLPLEIREGRFRQDLFYRLAVIHISIPPLRERGDDIYLLVEHFLKTLQPAPRHAVGIDDEALWLLRRYSWPGNIRELRNVIERAMVLADGAMINANSLPEELRRDVAPKIPISASVATGALPSTEATLASGAYEKRTSQTSRDDAVKQAEREYLLTLLESVQGNVSQASKQAGLSRQGLHKLLRSHNIEADTFRKK